MRLLTFLVVMFAICWLPWNLYNALTTLDVIDFSMTKTFPACHLIGMLSACANPILYGALNENFRVVFKQRMSERTARTRTTKDDINEAEMEPLNSEKGNQTNDLEMH